LTPSARFIQSAGVQRRCLHARPREGSRARWRCAGRAKAARRGTRSATGGLPSVAAIGGDPPCRNRYREPNRGLAEVSRVFSVAL
jgi:hypothetical protein